jgi:hypothetical protein
MAAFYVEAILHSYFLSDVLSLSIIIIIKSVSSSSSSSSSSACVFSILQMTTLTKFLYARQLIAVINGTVASSYSEQLCKRILVSNSDDVRLSLIFNLAISLPLHHHQFTVAYHSEICYCCSLGPPMAKYTPHAATPRCAGTRAGGRRAEWGHMAASNSVYKPA